MTRLALRLLWCGLAMVPAIGHVRSAAAQSFEDLDRLEQRIGEFASRDGARRSPRVDRRLRLAACDTLPRILWYGTGETTVLVRCGGPKSWQVYVPVTLVQDQPGQHPVKTGAVVVTRPVARGAALSAADLRIEPQTTVIGGARAIEDVAGKIAVRALNPGEAVRATMVAPAPMVRRGDPIQIKTGGAGIEIAVDGVAEEDGPAGARVRVRNAATGGRMQAIVAAPGIVVLPGYKISESGRE